MAQYERTIIDLVESTARNFKTLPLNLGAVQGSGGGVGAPPGGYIGWLPQTRVAYDSDELATTSTSVSGSILDNLNHIRYRLNTLESGGSIIVTDDNNSLSYLDTTDLHFVGSGVVVTDLGGGEIQIEINATGSGGGSGISQSYADTHYLKLNTTNDPLTDTLEVINNNSGNTGIYIQTTDDAYGLDNEQYTVDDNLTSDNYFGYQESSGAGDIVAPFIEGWRSLGGSGIATGNWIHFEEDGDSKFDVDDEGNAYTRGNLLITEAPIDGNSYSRKDGSWVVASGGSGSGELVVSKFLYMTGTLQDISVDSSYPYGLSTVKDTSVSTGTASSVGNAEYVIKIVMSDGFSSGFTTIARGRFKTYFTLKQNSGTRVVTAYATIHKVASDGTDTLLATTNSTSAITGSYVMYSTYVDAGPFTLNVTDRLVAKIRIVGEASGTDASVSIQTGNTDGERLEVPATNNVELEIQQTGWIPVAHVWTRTGNHTFTVRGDVTASYRKGAKIRYKDGGSYEYGYIISSSYSSPNTTVTLATNSDYAMAAATITDTYISYTQNPEGFPKYLNFTPSWVNVTVGNGTQYGYFSIESGILIGNAGLIWNASSPTSSVSGQIALTPPVPLITAAVNYTTVGAAGVIDNATALYMGECVYTTGSSVIELRVINTAGTYAVWTATSATVPITMAANDRFTMEFNYTI